jgi:hypothetical protein
MKQKRKNKKLFVIHPAQTSHDSIRKYCFDRCNKIIIAMIVHDELGAMYPCEEEDCPYEENRLRLNGTVQDRPVWLRKLKEVNCKDE